MQTLPPPNIPDETQFYGNCPAYGCEKAKCLMSLMSCPWSRIPVVSTVEFAQQIRASKDKNIIGRVTLDMKLFAADAKIYSKVARDIFFQGTGHHVM